MSRQYFQITKSRRASGLTDFFAVVLFAVAVLLFYLALKFTVGIGKFSVGSESKNIQDSMSLLSMLRTQVSVDNKDISLSQLISIGIQDSSKMEIARKNILELMDTYDSSNCLLMCVNSEKIYGSGCGKLNTYPCHPNKVFIPGYDKNLIEISFRSDTEALNTQSKPFK